MRKQIVNNSAVNNSNFGNLAREIQKISSRFFHKLFFSRTNKNDSLQILTQLIPEFMENDWFLDEMQHWAEMG